MTALLAAREARAHHVQALRAMVPIASVLVLKINQPGSDKNPPHAPFLRRVFDPLIQTMFDGRILQAGKASSLDGDYCYYRIDDDAATIKAQLIDLEETHPLGRLIDLDVYGENPITRADLNRPPRPCLVCDDVAHVCARSNRHTTHDLEEAIASILQEHLINWLSEASHAAIERELTLHPKFGLVSTMDPGCHTDMDHTTFRRSTQAILPYLRQFVQAGCDDTIDPFRLKKIGLAAERAMFAATNGINTQKGLIFLLGLFLPSLAHVVRTNGTTTDLRQNIQSIARSVIGDYYEALSQDTSETHGDDVYLTYGVRGIRAQALEGLAVLFDIPTCPADDPEVTDHQYLIELMARIDDTTIIHKNDLYTLHMVQRDMTQVLEQGGYLANREDVHRLSEQYKQSRISPGGSADLLVLKILLEELRPYLNEEEEST